MKRKTHVEENLEELASENLQKYMNCTDKFMENSRREGWNKIKVAVKLIRLMGNLKFEIKECRKFEESFINGFSMMIRLEGWKIH